VMTEMELCHLLYRLREVRAEGSCALHGPIARRHLLRALRLVTIVHVERPPPAPRRSTAEPPVILPLAKQPKPKTKSTAYQEPAPVPADGARPSKTWRVGNTRLHPYVYDNARYLLNPATGVVFQEPQIVGHMHSIDSPGADPSAPQMLTVSWTRSASPRPSPHSSYEASPRSPRPTTDFVDAMCKKLHVTALLMTGPTSPLCSLLSRFASPGKDHLTSAQLGDLVRAVMPGITSAKLRYLQVMMDEDGDGNVSFMELQDLFLTCKLLGKSLLLKNDVSVHDVILKMGKFMLYSDATPLELFQIFDLEDVGGLGRTQLQRLVRVFMPALDSEEAATLVSQWLAMKKDDLGKMMSHLAEMRRRAEQFKQLGSDAPQKKLRTSWDDVRFSKDRNGSQTKKSSNL
ncbi:hypothetical protein CYMTET_35436, partial [Cymbomonas tetramitiformis]